MQFIILTYESDDDVAARTDVARQAAYWGGWQAFGGALKAAGVVKSMHGLAPKQTASTTTVRSGERRVAAGPFTAGEMQLGGYFIIDVADAAAAEEWAARCPAAINGAVEVRPVM
ncbi:MAG: hypothetical protein JWN11_2337 [Hyphomicrobiales bacterium]|nr:hypothetical protein [Hyphomicrobiales bacterium]